MALLMDGLVSGVEALVQVDSGVTDVARAEGISIYHKLDLAQRDCELKILQFVVNHGLEARLGTTNNMPRLDRITVNDGLKRWFALYTLQLMYSDAYYRSLNDRYGKKYEHFRDLASTSWEEYTDTGITCVYDPIPRGTIAGLETNEIPIGSGAYVVALAWVSASGESGALSEHAAIEVGPSQGFTLAPGPAPSGVAGYDVYAGSGGTPLWKQNVVAVDPESAFQASTVISGAGMPSEPGQGIDFVLRRNRMFTRG